MAFLVEFDHHIFQPCSTLHKESNATRIASIGVRTEKLRLVKVPVTKISAMVFSELCLQFPASHDVPKVGRLVLGVPRHLHFDSPAVVHASSGGDGRKTCTNVARWRGFFFFCGFECERETEEVREEGERKALMG